MSGTRKGGLAAAAKIKAERGADFYARIGRTGGKNGRTGGFASMAVGKDGLTGPERARVKGREGGRISRRTKVAAVTSVN